MIATSCRPHATVCLVSPNHSAPPSPPAALCPPVCTPLATLSSPSAPCATHHRLPTSCVSSLPLSLVSYTENACTHAYMHRQMHAFTLVACAWSCRQAGTASAGHAACTGAHQRHVGGLLLAEAVLLRCKAQLLLCPSQRQQRSQVAQRVACAAC